MFVKPPGRCGNIVVNATPLGMKQGDPMPMDVSRIPAYLEFFGYPTTTPDELRGLATIRY